jgi:hypothetical protein
MNFQIRQTESKNVNFLISNRNVREDEFAELENQKF